MKTSLILVAVMLGVSSASSGTSILTTRLEDPQAVYLAAPEFNARGDGKTDDSAQFRAAVDEAEKNAREGIVFISSGRYRLTRTIYVWPGVRVFGYGATRPVFLLVDNTPGFGRARALW